MPLTGNIPHDIKAELAAGKPQKQAVAIALSKHRGDGGDEETIMDSAQTVLDDTAEQLNQLHQRMDAQQEWMVTCRVGSSSKLSAEKKVKVGAGTEAEARQKAIRHYKEDDEEYVECVSVVKA